MLIDAHVHVLDHGHWPSLYFDHVANQWGNRQPQKRDPSLIRDKIEPGLLDPEGDQIIADMGAARVDLAVQLPIDWGPELDEPASSSRKSMAAVNQKACQIADRHAGRLIAFVGIDPRRENALSILRRSVEDMGAVGMKLYPPMGFYPFDQVAFTLYEYCQERSLPVLFHTGVESLPMTRPRFANPLYLADVQVAFPRLPIWIAHAGGSRWWDEAVAVAARATNTYLELSTWIWSDTDESRQNDFIRKLERARDLLGPHRLIFGSDHVSGDRVRGREFLPKVVSWYRELPARAKKLGVTFTQDDMRLILGGNAAELLRLTSRASPAAGGQP